MSNHSNKRLASQGLWQPGAGRGGASTLGKNALARIFRVHLATSLLMALKPRGTQLSSIGLLASSFQGRPLETFNDLLTHPSPPIPLLRMAKEFAKRADKTTVDPLPSEIALSLYFLVLAAALLRHQSSISTLTPCELHQGFAWTHDRPWLDQANKHLIATAAENL
jgi:hypothetical protein